MKKKENRTFYTLGELIYLARMRKGASRKDIVDFFNEEKMDEQDVSLKGKITHNKVTEKTVRKWENDLKYPDIDIIYALARFLDADPNYMIAAKQFVQKYSVNSLAMKIVGFVCYILDITSNYVGFYRKLVAESIRIILIITTGIMLVQFMS